VTKKKEVGHLFDLYPEAVFVSRTLNPAYNPINILNLKH